MISRKQARQALERFANTWFLTRVAEGEDPGPLIFLGKEGDPFWRAGVLREEEDGRSAYHVAHAIHPVLKEVDADSVTVCMFAYKVIQGIKYHGFLLYHVDEEGYRHTRILDPERGNHWLLDGSPFWKSFPYTFGDGPHDMPAILGRHEESSGGGFDELLRP